MPGSERKWSADELSPNTSFQEEKKIDSVRGIKNRDTPSKDSHVEVHTGKNFLLKVKVHIPVDERPDFNFVGKLLGPGGSSLQQLQQATQTKMAIRGRGSIKDKKKEEELLNQGDPKYSHLHEALHIIISAYTTPAEAYRRMSSAIEEIQKFLVHGDYFDEMRPSQYDSKPKPPFVGEGQLTPMGGLPLPPGGRYMGPMMGDPELPRRPGMAQSTYDEEWLAPKTSPRNGGFRANATAPVPCAARDYFDEMRPSHYDGKPKPPFAGEGPLAPMGILPLPPRGGHMGPMMGGREFSGLPGMAQSRYYEEWSAPKAWSRNGRFHGNATAPVPRIARPHEEQANYYNSYGYFNSGKAASYCYYGEADTSYADGYADEARGPVRSAAGGRGQTASRIQIYSYAGAIQHRY